MHGAAGAARRDPALALGVNTVAGHVTNAPVAEFLGVACRRPPRRPRLTPECTATVECRGRGVGSRRVPTGTGLRSKARHRTGSTSAHEHDPGAAIVAADGERSERGARPVHVACIMDGNGRWAAAPRPAAHRRAHRGRGEPRPARARRRARATSAGSPCSASRPRTGFGRAPRCATSSACTSKLFGRVAELNELNVRVQWMGRPFDEPEARTPKYVQRAIRKAIADTAGNTGMVLTVAFDYGSRAEIVDAAGAAAARGARSTSRRSIGDAPLPARAAAGRRRRAHVGRAADLQLHAVAVRRRARCYFTDRAVAGVRRRRARRRARRSSALDDGRPTTALARRRRRARRPPRTVPASGRWPTAVAAAIADRPPPRRAGRHRDRQDARLPRAGDRRRASGSSWPPPPRRCRTSSPPRTCRSSQRRTSASTSTWACSRAAATTSACSGCASCAPADDRPARARGDGRATRKLEIKRLAEWAGDDATPATSPSCRLAPPTAAWQAVSVGSDECPGAEALPDGRAVLRRAGPPARRSTPTSSSSTLHLYGLDVGQRRRDPARARRASWSTRPTSSRTS